MPIPFLLLAAPLGSLIDLDCLVETGQLVIEVLPLKHFETSDEVEKGDLLVYLAAVEPVGLHPLAFLGIVGAELDGLPSATELAELISDSRVDARLLKQLVLQHLGSESPLSGGLVERRSDVVDQVRDDCNEGSDDVADEISAQKANQDKAHVLPEPELLHELALDSEEEDGQD